MLRTDDLDYPLSNDRIAQRPAEPRDAARLLVVPRSTPTELLHTHFHRITDRLNRGDLLVINRTRVLPAKIVARREDTSGKVTGLFLDAPEPNIWRVMLKSNGKLREKQRIILQTTPPIAAELIEREHDAWRIRLEADQTDPAQILAEIGATPLPPYITGARRVAGTEIADTQDREWYQCVYAGQGASVAAPTAGLHFTPALLSQLTQSGVQTAEVILDVGAGTFKPVETEFVEDHPIHSERFFVPDATRLAIDQTRAAGGRVFAVGTTTTRALESAAAQAWANTDHWHTTDLMILPGHRFQAIDALITNFHQPRSTLLALVAALLPGGVPQIREIYAQAAALEYRFFSYGDAMLILP